MLQISHLPQLAEMVPVRPQTHLFPQGAQCEERRPQFTERSAAASGSWESTEPPHQRTATVLGLYVSSAMSSSLGSSPPEVWGSPAADSPMGCWAALCLHFPTSKIGLTRPHWHVESLYTPNIGGMRPC